MLSAVIDVHRNILSAQCLIRYDVNQTLVNSLQVICANNFLKLSLFDDSELKNEFTILTPKNLFIPTTASIENGSSCTIEIEKNDCCKILQNSNFSKYRKVVKRHLDTLTSENKLNNSSDSTVNDITVSNKNISKTHKCIKFNCSCNNDHSDGKQHCKQKVSCPCKTHVQDIAAIEIEGIDYSEHCVSVKDIIELSFRLQLSSNEVIPKNDEDNLSCSKLLDFLKAEIQEDDIYDVFCSSCGCVISSSPVYFQEFKEYSTSFSDLSESWFCHKNPQPGIDLNIETLYVDDFYIYLHSVLLKSFHLDLCENEYKCKNCHTLMTLGTISERNKQYLKRVFPDALTLRKIGSQLPCNKKVRHMSVLLSLWSMIKQKTSLFCRLFLQSKVEDSNVCLLMWISCAEVSQFKFQAATDNIPSEVNFSIVPVYKVQYHVSSLSSELVQAWSKDFGVDFFNVSSYFIQTIKDLLMSSSEYIPGGKIKLDGFSNGCLPANYAYFTDIEL